MTEPSDTDRRIDDPDEQSALSDFSADLQEDRVNDDVGQAEVFDLYVDERWTDKTAATKREGLVVIFETATGVTFTEWLPKPDPQDRLARLNVLLEYTDVDAGGLDDLLGERIPIRHIHGEWQVDWTAVEHTIETPHEGPAV